MKLRTVVLVGLVARLLLAPFVAHPYDTFARFVLGEDLFQGKMVIWSFLVPYRYSFFIFVFPSTYLYNLLSHFVPNYTLMSASLDPRLNPGSQWGITIVPGLLFDFLLKLPLILSDLIVALLIYKIILKQIGDQRLAIFGASLWFLNPFVIWISSGWGTFDTLPALFTVLAFYFMLEKRFVFSAVSIILGAMMKYYAVALILPMIVIIWKTNRFGTTLKFLLACTVTSVLLLLPALQPSLLGFAGTAVNSQSQSGTFYSGLSFWSAFSLFFVGINVNLISTILLVLTMIFAYVWIIRFVKKDFDFAVASFTITITILLLFYRFVAENFFVWLLPFLIMIAVKNSRFHKLYWLLTGIALVSSMTDSLLPFYLLPVSPWLGPWLVKILSFANPYRVAPNGTIVAGIALGKVFLSALGLAATSVLALIVIMVIKKRITVLRQPSSENV